MKILFEEIMEAIVNLIVYSALVVFLGILLYNLTAI